MWFGFFSDLIFLPRKHNVKKKLSRDCDLQTYKSKSQRKWLFSNKVNVMSRWIDFLNISLEWKIYHIQNIFSFNFINNIFCKFVHFQFSSPWLSFEFSNREVNFWFPSNRFLRKFYFRSSSMSRRHLQSTTKTDFSENYKSVNWNHLKMVEKIREHYQKHSRNISSVSDVSVSTTEPIKRDENAEIRCVLLCDR